MNLDPWSEDCKSKGIVASMCEYEASAEIDEELGIFYIADPYDTAVHILPGELGMQVPFNVGDRVRHKQYGHEYIVYRLPYADKRMYGLKDSYTTGEINHITCYGNTLWVQDDDGVIEPEGFGNHPLNENEAYYKNFEKI